jgi:hypothetical protein
VPDQVVAKIRRGEATYLARVTATLTTTLKRKSAVLLLTTSTTFGIACTSANDEAPPDDAHDASAVEADAGGGPADAGPCAVTDVFQTGVCQTVLGVAWSGTFCEPVSGCGCGQAVPDCDGAECACPPYSTVDECVAASVACGACAVVEASEAPDCGDPSGQAKWAWNGSYCVRIPPHCCAGADCCAGIGCGRLFDDETQCMSNYEACPGFSDAGELDAPTD